MWSFGAEKILTSVNDVERIFLIGARGETSSCQWHKTKKRRTSTQLEQPQTQPRKLTCCIMTSPPRSPQTLILLLLLQLPRLSLAFSALPYSHQATAVASFSHLNISPLYSSRTGNDGSNGSTEPPALFPMSTRAALIEKAKDLDSNLKSGKPTGVYSDTGWSNRLGTVLTPASIPGVYTGDREFIWNNIGKAWWCSL